MILEYFINFMVVAAWAYVACGIIAASGYAILRAHFLKQSLFQGKMAVMMIILTGLIWPLVVLFLINRFFPPRNPEE
jgi:hypothetical protein